MQPLFQRTHKSLAHLSLPLLSSSQHRQEWLQRVIARCVLQLLWIGSFLLSAESGYSQWVTQTFELKEGWNAIYLHVDPSHATLDELIGAQAPEFTPIEQVWRWTPDEAKAQFITSPQQPIDSGSQWAAWRRTQPEVASLSRIHANFAYLVYSRENYTWRVKGKPVVPRYQWTTSGLNFVGFPTVETGAPSFENFLADAPLWQTLVSGEGGVFHYTGGDFSNENPAKLYLLQATPVRRGEAYWIKSGQPNFYNKYYGPFEVIINSSYGLNFGNHLSTLSFRLRNQTKQALRVKMRLRASETAPSGQPAVVAVPPLLLRGELNPEDRTYSASVISLSSQYEWELAPQGQVGEEIEVVIGLDRASLDRPPGQLLAAVIELTDSLGYSQVDFGVTAEAASTAGLWAGTAVINKVAQYLKTYAKDSNGNLIVQEDGSYAVENVDTTLQPVAEAYSLRLIVHNPDENSGNPAVLLQQVYLGPDNNSNLIVATRQSALDETKLSEARRLSAVHLPWTKENQGWNFNGRLPRGKDIIETTVITPYDAQSSNPFLHTYHPDHDNLDVRFESQLPQGSESYRIERKIRLEMQPPGIDFRSRVNAGFSFFGKYSETIRLIGLARPGGQFDTREFQVEGLFTLQRIAEIPVLTRTP